MKQQIPPDMRVDFVIATLPDAIDSNSRWQFDPMYDAIQRAVTASGYVVDRFYIPDWDATRNPDEDAPSLGRIHEQLPGVVLFRRGRGAQEGLLVLFLVFETPTSGVHQLAFQRAVWTMANWPMQDERVRIIGPTFSGSIDSLAQTMVDTRKALEQTVKYRVVSGSATSAENGDILAKRLPGDGLSYHTTVLSDDELLGVLRRFLDARLDRGRMAVLVEGNTDYGRLLAERLGGGGTLCEGGCPVLSFPLHVSRLRGAAINQSAQAAAADTRRSLPLSLEDPSLIRDQLPPMTPRLTSSSTDAALTAILNTVEREKIAAIGLFATDARDKLFLAQQIALRSPDTLLFTMEADLLLAHPDYQRYTDGMIVASSYPLLSVTQLWQPTATPDSARHQFGSTNAEGVYNATLALLNYTEDGTASQGMPPLLDYRRDPGDRHGPFAWISAVGRDGIWPLHRDGICSATPKDDESGRRTCLDNALYVQKALAAPGPGPTSMPNIPRLERPLTLASGLLVFIMALQMFVGLHVWWWWLRETEHAVAWWDAAAVHRTRALTLGVACCVSLLLMQLAALVVLNQYNTLVAQYMASDKVAAWLEFVAAIMSGLLLAVICRIASEPDLRIDKRWLAGGVLAGVFVLDGLVVPQLAQAMMGAEPLILMNRGVQPLTGVSPFVPVFLILLVLYAAPAVHFLRTSTRTLTHLHESPDGATPLSPLATGNFHVLVGKVRDAITDPLGLERRHVMAVGFAVAASILVVRVQGLQTAERTSFDAVFVFGWLLVQTVVCLALAQHYYLWRTTKGLLKGCSVHPMVEAFGRVPRELFLNRMPPRGPRLIHLQHAVNAQTVVTSGLWSLYRSGSLAAPFAAYAMNFEERRRWMHAALGLKPADALPSTEPDIHALQETLALQTKLDADFTAERRHVVDTQTWTSLITGVETLLPCLQRFWSRRAASLVDGAQSGSADKDLDAWTKWHRDAEVFVAIPIALMIRELMSRAVRGLYVIFGGLLLLVLYQASFSSYPYRVMLATTWVYVCAGIIAAVSTIIPAERDTVLSRLGGTTPGRIEWDFAFMTRTLMPLLLALLTLFAVQFPDAGGAVLRWLRPVQTALP